MERRSPQSENFHEVLKISFSDMVLKIPNSEYKIASHEYKILPRDTTKNVCAESTPRKPVI
jgi:hypothetical protein